MLQHFLSNRSFILYQSQRLSTLIIRVHGDFEPSDETNREQDADNLNCHQRDSYGDEVVQNFLVLAKHRPRAPVHVVEKSHWS